MDKFKVDDKIKIVNKIIDSEELRHSKIYGDLLSYLFESHKEGRHLKEAAIAVGFFKKNSDYHPLFDSTVRTYMFHLRKKLEAYYQKSGKEDKIRLRIPKGVYQIEFYINKTIKKNEKKQDLPLWGDFFNSEKPKLIVLGDVFMYHEYREDIHDTVAVRNLNVNSLEDLKKYKEKHGLKQVDSRLPGYSYYNLTCVHGLKTIIPFFSHYDVPFSIKEVSRLTIEDLKHYEILFIGNTRCLGFLKKFINRSSIAVRIDNEKMCFNTSEEKEYFFPYERDSYYKDFGLFLKIPGLNENTVLISLAFHVSGMIGLLEKLTDLSFLNQLNKKNGENGLRGDFKSLFEIAGYNVEAYNCEILSIEPLPDDLNIWK